MAKYGHEVIERVGVDEANGLRADKSARRVIKSSRWLLLCNRENVPADHAVQLDELLAATKVHLTAYLLQDDLNLLWRFPTRERIVGPACLEALEASGRAQ